LLLAFELFYFLVVKAKIKELFAALKAVARAPKKTGHLLNCLNLRLPRPPPQRTKKRKWKII